MTNSFAGNNYDDPETKKIVHNQNINRDEDIKSMDNIIESIEVNLIPYQDKYLYNITGKVLDSNLIRSNRVLFVRYWGANKPTFTKSFSGSALPFPNEKIAFDNSKNSGVVQVVNTRFSFNITIPNSYYKNMGTELVPPEINMIIINTNNEPLTKKYTINLSENIPYRTLTWNDKRKWIDGPLFYQNSNLPIRTQYQILVDGKYPSNNIEHKNYWGGKPAL